jgi:nicotinate-nucleotide pyrophosphorylase (carboxylating)
MFDNIKPAKIIEILARLKDYDIFDRVIFEASGGINLNNIIEYAATGVDIISLGALTHSVRSLDVKLDLKDLNEVI